MSIEDKFRQHIPRSWRILKMGFIAALTILLCLSNSGWAIAQSLPSQNVAPATQTPTAPTTTQTPTAPTTTQTPTAPTTTQTPTAPATTQTLTPFVRENISTFIQSPQKLQALRNGIARMKSRPASNPTSWLYQANIHGTNDLPALDLWNTCQHGSFFFLSWHRMYLYYFERILRAAAAEANPSTTTLTLPYWNYSDAVAQRVLPQPFRTPANASNPLYNSNRANPINLGQSLSAQDVSYQQALQSTRFIGTNTNGGFGGGRIPAAQHFGSLRGLLESQPHNIIHVRIGGNMSAPERAARDPIFWLHHANIDRLWESWLARGNTNATSDRTFLDTSFSFFDENGTKVSLTGSQILNTVTQLNYRYDRLSPIGSQPSPQRTSIEVGETPITQMALRTAIQPRSTTPVSRSIVNIEGIEYDPNNLVPYEIYLNLPSGVTPSPDNPYFVGTLSLFAFPQGSTYSLDVTEVVNRLKSANLLKDEKLAVTVVPPSPEQYLTTAQVEKLSSSNTRSLSLRAAMRESPDISIPKIRFKKMTTSVVTE